MGNRSLEVTLPPAYISLCRRVERDHPRYGYLFDQGGSAPNSGHSLATRLGFIQQLGLDKPGAGLTTLDIGAGSGLWSWLLKNQGHHVISTNPEPARPTWLDAAYLEAHAALGLPCAPLSVRAFTPLPGGQVDLITTLKTAFHPAWSVDEWEFFLLDVMRCLRPGGRALLQVNHTGAAAGSFAALCAMSLPEGWARQGHDVFTYQVAN